MFQTKACIITALTAERQLRAKDHDQYLASLAGVTQVVKDWQLLVRSEPGLTLLQALHQERLSNLVFNILNENCNGFSNSNYKDLLTSQIKANI